MLWDDDCPKQLLWSDHAICRNNTVQMVGVLEPLRWTAAFGNSKRTHSDSDDPLADRWFKTGPNSVRPAPFFPGLRFGPRSSSNEREDLFGIERVESYLVLYRWPKAGETVGLTEAGQGQFSTISNALKFKLSNEAIFTGNCRPKNK